MAKSPPICLLCMTMIRRLLQANLRNDCQAIEEVEGLLGNIADAWKQISPKASSQESR